MKIPSSLLAGNRSFMALVIRW